jgi:cation diffusion facilitator family transporter
MSEAKGRRRASRRILLVSLWLTVLMLAMKVWVGWATQSLSLLAASLHTLITSFSIFLSVIALASPYGSGREIWGHTKLESALAFLLLAFLGFAGFSLLALAVPYLIGFFSGQPAALSLQINLPLIQLLSVLTATNFCLALLQRYQASVLESAALDFTTQQQFRDVWLMILVLLALTGAWQGYAWLDPAIAVLLLLIVIGGCWRIFNVQLPAMVRQVAIAPEAVAQTVHQVEGITHCYNIRSRGMVGRQLLIELRLILHPEYKATARSVAERVERVIRERYGPARVVIYVDSDASEELGPGRK